MTFPLRVFAIDREIFIGDAKSLIVPAATGQIQILANHAPLISLLKEGDMAIEQENGSRQNIPIAGGVVEVKPREVVALVNF